MFYYSDNVDKELKYNQNIFSSSIDSHIKHIQKNNVVLKIQAPKVWRHFGDNFNGAIAKRLLYMYNSAEGDTHKPSLEWWKHQESQFPLLAKLVKVVFLVPAGSSKSERVFSLDSNVVTPKRAMLNPEKVEDLVRGEMQLMAA